MSFATLSTKSNIYDLLKETTSFDVDSQSLQSVECWKLSDLAILYSESFSIVDTIKQYSIDKMNTNIKRSLQLHDLEKTPEHIKTIQHHYQILIDPCTSTHQLSVKDYDQKLTRVACEYLFHNIPGKEFEQAFFLYPNKSYSDLQNLCQPIHFERIYSKTKELVDTLSTIINLASHNSLSVSKILNEMWCKMFNFRSYSELCQTCGFDPQKPLIDYMSPHLLQYINTNLQKLILNFNTNHSLTIDEVQTNILDMALKTYSKCHYYGNNLTDKLLKTTKEADSIKQVRQQRLLFWRNNYLQKSFH